MSHSPDPGLTALLSKASAGDLEASNRVLTHYYTELHRLAHHHMRSLSPGSILQTTALLNSAYLRLFARKTIQFRDRLHFVASYGLAIKHALIEHVRSEKTEKRLHTVEERELDELHAAFKTNFFDVLALEETLTEYRGKNPQMCEALEAMLFSGMTRKEAAEYVGLSMSRFEDNWPIMIAFFNRRLR